MDFVRLKKFTQYFERHPPVHIMIAAYLGVGAGGDEAQSAEPVGDSADAVLDMLDPEN